MAVVTIAGRRPQTPKQQAAAAAAKVVAQHRRVAVAHKQFLQSVSEPSRVDTMLSTLQQAAFAAHATASRLHQNVASLAQRTPGADLTAAIEAASKASEAAHEASRLVAMHLGGGETEPGT